MACASSMQKKGGFVIILFILSLKQTMTIKVGYLHTCHPYTRVTHKTMSSVSK